MTTVYEIMEKINDIYSIINYLDRLGSDPYMNEAIELLTEYRDMLLKLNIK